MLRTHHSRRSPYLKGEGLGDVLAAIQAMALHERYRQSCADWAEWISGDKSRSDYWRQVFDDHPEFFRRSYADDDYSLILRRALVTQPQQNRPALSETQIKLLMDEASTCIVMNSKPAEIGGGGSHRRYRSLAPSLVRFWLSPPLHYLSVEHEPMTCVVCGETFTPRGARTRTRAAALAVRSSTARRGRRE
jgi:hypothetical protein